MSTIKQTQPPDDNKWITSEEMVKKSEMFGHLKTIQSEVQRVRDELVKKRNELANELQKEEREK